MTEGNPWRTTEICSVDGKAISGFRERQVMFEGLLDSVVDFDGDSFGNIPSIVRSEDILDDLSDSAAERRYGEAAIEAERKYEGPESPIILRPFLYGTAITDFHYACPVIRFSDGTRFGVWYGCLELITTVHETVYYFVKRIRDRLALIDSEIVSERKIFLVRVAGILVDLRRKHLRFQGLTDPKDYEFTNSVGAYLYSRGQSGLLVKSARCEDTNIAVFDPKILSNVRHSCYMAHRWNPQSDSVIVENPPNILWTKINI